jgi:hypothetical protein
MNNRLWVNPDNLKLGAGEFTLNVAHVVRFESREGCAGKPLCAQYRRSVCFRRHQVLQPEQTFA